ncbi:MAG: amidohydrolase family protein [Acidimicrobiia bacterium]
MDGIIDSDQHLVEYRGLWSEHADPGLGSDALELVDDAVGNTWIEWRGRRLSIAEVQTPGETSEIGERRVRARRGDPPAHRYDDLLPRDHWDPSARRKRVLEMGCTGAVLFPNYGLLWERELSIDLPALLGNMRSWNRWCGIVVSEGADALFPVAHLSLRDLTWLRSEVRALEAAGVRLAMVSPGLVDGKPLSHRDLDDAWAMFVAHGVTPVFHVADQSRPFDDAWYRDRDDAFVPVLDSVFLYVGAALACTDLIVNGVLERHPDLRIGIVELSAVWVPMYLMMLDGGVDFTTRLNGFPPAELSLRPSEYFRRQIRVSSFSYELPSRLRRQVGPDLLMACSDYPHSEGTATPLADYAGTGAFATTPTEDPGLFGGNVAFLLRRD